MMQASFGQAAFPTRLQVAIAAPRIPRTQAFRGPIAGGLQHFRTHFRICA